MPIPTQSDVHVNKPLTNLVEAYSQDEADYVSMQVFPPVPVDNKSDDFYKWSRADLLRAAMQKRAPGALAEMGGVRLETATYTASEFALGYPIPDSIRRNADNMLNLDMAGTKYLTQQALLNREIAWSTAFFTAGSGWRNVLVGQAGDSDATHVKFWNTDGSTPIDDVLFGKKLIKKRTGYEPNYLVLGYETKEALKTNAQILDRLKYGQTPGAPVLVKNSDLAQLFEVDKVLVMGAIQTTTPEGIPEEDADYDFVGGQNALLAYAAPAPGIMVASGGYTFNWKGLNGATANGWRMKKYRNEDRESDILEVQQAYVQKLTAPDLGTIFSEVLEAA